LPPAALRADMLRQQTVRCDLSTLRTSERRLKYALKKSNKPDVRYLKLPESSILTGCEGNAKGTGFSYGQRVIAFVQREKADVTRAFLPIEHMDASRNDRSCRCFSEYPDRSGSDAS
jgi:hypothetical protein